MTSLACMCGENIFQYKKPLTVGEGECGLRQSEALFQHIKNLPVVFEEMEKDLKISDFEDVLISVSTRPRSVSGSYMPVFLAGQSFAKSLKSIIGAKYFETSHQDGHIMAVAYTEKKLSVLTEPFISLHLSGGTTEILLCTMTDKGFECKIIGGTKDLPCGQFIDRIGVLTGRAFPAGKYLDYGAVNFNGKTEKRKICVDGGYMNFSGEETHIRRLYNDGKIDSEEAGYMTMKYIADSVKQAVLNVKEEYGIDNVLMAGGVSSSAFLKNTFCDVPGVYFAAPEFSGDNAVGVCALGKFFNGDCK